MFTSAHMRQVLRPRVVASSAGVVALSGGDDPSVFVEDLGGKTGVGEGFAVAVRLGDLPAADARLSGGENEDEGEERGFKRNAGRTQPMGDNAQNEGTQNEDGQGDSAEREGGPSEEER